VKQKIYYSQLAFSSFLEQTDDGGFKGPIRICRGKNDVRTVHYFFEGGGGGEEWAITGRKNFTPQKIAQPLPQKIIFRP